MRQSTILLCTWALLWSATSTTVRSSPQTASASQPSRTKVVLLGTGTPSPTPDRSGPATAIVVNDTAYVVDLGPGVVRRAMAAATTRGIAALQPVQLRTAFLTHVDSDHTIGFPDLILSPWTLGRRVPLEIYGPRGVKAMSEHLLEAYRLDIETRTNPDGNQRSFPDGHRVNAHEIAAGVVFKDANVTVSAFPTTHAMESFGYRFQTADRSIVVSGDTNPTQATIDACRGCDVLVHEVLTLEWLAKRRDFQGYAAQFHTTTAQLTELAMKAKPRLLVLSHASLSLRPVVDSERSTPAVLLSEMSGYPGRVVVGRDLDVY
jgi:ribonuclease Z